MGDEISKKCLQMDIKSGDIFLFSNWSPSGISIKILTWSEWSHCGIATWVGDRICVFEAGTICKPDVLYKGEQFSGTRLVFLSDLLTEYTRIGVRRLKIERDITYLSKHKNFILENTGKGFQTNLLEIMKNQFTTDNDQRYFFCSELCAYYMKKMIPDIPENWFDNKTTYRYYPGDFSTNLLNNYFDGNVKVFYSSSNNYFQLSVVLIILILFILGIITGK